ncbi:hypothetical protein [Aliarcobacter cryaerophilus]|uniref:Uncharacterized protein n=1 Tax=Arcobacter sp. AZ-2023 TaxID=3074453 RepID=A0AA96I443_9BACT|nr:hypothetical protein RJG54_11940 [Arcobacter sp. AZ-2023]
MHKKFIKVHQTTFRARYKLELLKNEFIDEDILKDYFLELDFVKSVRINKKAYSIIFELKQTDFSRLEKILEKLNLDTLLKYCEKKKRQYVFLALKVKIPL